jgi:hypothetical protein
LYYKGDLLSSLSKCCEAKAVFKEVYEIAADSPINLDALDNLIHALIHTKEYEDTNL